MLLSSYREGLSSYWIFQGSKVTAARALSGSQNTVRAFPKYLAVVRNLTPTSHFQWRNQFYTHWQTHEEDTDVLCKMYLSAYMIKVSFLRTLKRKKLYILSSFIVFMSLAFHCASFLAFFLGEEFIGIRNKFPRLTTTTETLAELALGVENPKGPLVHTWKYNI